MDLVVEFVIEAFFWLFDWGDGRERRREQRRLKGES